MRRKEVLPAWNARDFTIVSGPFSSFFSSSFPSRELASELDESTQSKSQLILVPDEGLVGTTMCTLIAVANINRNILPGCVKPTILFVLLF